MVESSNSVIASGYIDMHRPHYHQSNIGAAWRCSAIVAQYWPSPIQASPLTSPTRLEVMNNSWSVMIHLINILLPIPIDNSKPWSQTGLLKRGFTLQIPWAFKVSKAIRWPRQSASPKRSVGVMRSCTFLVTCRSTVSSTATTWVCEGGIPETCHSIGKIWENHY